MSNMDDAIWSKMAALVCREVAIAEDETTAAPTRTRIIGYEGPRKSILVVDDVAENRAMLRDLLTGLGFSVPEAADGLECLEAVRRFQPDMIIMDVAIPLMSRWMAARAIRLVPVLA